MNLNIRRYFYFLTVLMLACCSMEPQVIPPTSETARLSPESIRVISSDIVLKNQTCLALEQIKSFRKIYCDEDVPLKTEYTLEVEGKIRESSSDFGRSMQYSSLSLGTLLFVSSSAYVNYSFRLFHWGKEVDRFTLESEGRVGMWSALPPLTGVIGSAIGTLFNIRSTPENAQEECLGGEYNDENSVYQPCTLSQEFHQDALVQVWPEVQKKILPGAGPSELFCESCRLPVIEPEYQLIFYEGRMVSDNFGEILLQQKSHFIDSYITVMGLNYKHPTFIERITFETEGQLAKHRGLQDHWETNILLIARLEFWKTISFAYGEGLSYAWEVPETEGSPTTNQFLNYFLVEMDLGIPQLPRSPHLLFRIHHRSGVFGVYCPNRCGSNILTAGIKIPW